MLDQVKSGKYKSLKHLPLYSEVSWLLGHGSQSVVTSGTWVLNYGIRGICVLMVHSHGHPMEIDFAHTVIDQLQ